MGVVHLARRGDGARVALKVLRPHIVGDDEARAGWRARSSSLSRIRSRWVAEIVDADPWAPVPYVATRYVPGLSLHDYVHEEGPIEGTDLTWFAACLAEGVASVHAVGVLHRDVKPSQRADGGPDADPHRLRPGPGRRRPEADPHRLAARDAGLPRARDPARRRRHHRLRRALVGGHRRLRRDRQAAVRPRAVDGDHGPGPPRRAPPLRHPRAAAPAPRRLPRTPTPSGGRRWTRSWAGCGRRWLRRRGPAAPPAPDKLTMPYAAARTSPDARSTDVLPGGPPVGADGTEDAHRAPDRPRAGPARAPAAASSAARAGPSAVRRTGPARDPARGRRAAVRRHRGGLPLVRLGHPPAARLAAAQRLAGRQRGGRTGAGCAARKWYDGAAAAHPGPVGAAPHAARDRDAPALERRARGRSGAALLRVRRRRDGDPLRLRHGLRGRGVDRPRGLSRAVTAVARGEPGRAPVEAVAGRHRSSCSCSPPGSAGSPSRAARRGRPASDRPLSGPSSGHVSQIVAGWNS